MTLQEITSIIETYNYIPPQEEEVTIGGAKTVKKLEYKDCTITFEISSLDNGQQVASIEKGTQKFKWNKGTLEYDKIEGFVSGLD